MVSGIGSPSLMPYEPTLERTDGSVSKGTNAATNLVAASAHREASGDLTIKTLEGDTVTLSAHLEADATFASIRSRGAQASYLSLESSASFEITVQGDLNEQERADIEKLVKQFGRELRQFFRGSEGASAADVGRGEFSSLAGFAADFEASASLTAIAGEARPVPVDASDPGSVFLGPARPAEDPESPTADGSAGTAGSALAPDTSGLQVLVARLQRMVSTASVGPEKALRALGAVLDRLEDALGGDDRHQHVLDHVRRESGAPSAREGRTERGPLGPAQPAALGD
ncbi:MAG: hypothetical protein U0704_03760 [Candidatus Eisenbacteria bacterium]